MKCFIILIFCLFQYHFQQVYAQIFPGAPINVAKMENIDTGNIRVLYALNAVDINNYETYDDLQRLDIGSKVSKYYSAIVFISDSLSTDWQLKHPRSSGLPIQMGNWGKSKDKWNEYQYSDCFKDFPKNIFSEHIRMPWGAIPNAQYSEEIPVQTWNLLDDTLTIIGYLCQKATCLFRGRDYIAWFTTEIPISNGPWKFGGLPGLILKIYDTDNFYTWECIGIEYYKKKYSIKKYNYVNYKNINRKELIKLIKKIHENYFMAAGIVSDDGQTLPKIEPYNPIELE
ncbi:MAG: GLPGLI family protein [Prevotellaceae bacterium]|jgi:GLPGLI family protein|nr:GLPGLI family protein [Prevotellaceae bacterium]